MGTPHSSAIDYNAPSEFTLGVGIITGFVCGFAAGVLLTLLAGLALWVWV